MNLVQGVDVSEYEPRVDWRALRSQGIRFALVRATSGTGYVDRKFADHWTGARAQGLLRGAYHYLFAEEDPRRQAQLFISTLGSDKGELPPIVDIEDKYNENAPAFKIISACKAVLDIIEQAFGRKPMVYSRKTYLDPHFTQNGRAPAWAKDYDVWLAQYPFKYDPKIHPNANMPMQPVGWKPWKIWQYSEVAILEGVTGEDNRPTRIDLDWFNGTEADLYKFANVEQPDPVNYTVKAGDTFKSIADAQQLTITELLDANPSLLKAGMTLSVPGRVKPNPEPNPDPNPDPLPARPTKKYVVQSGDALSRLALKFHTTQEAIMALNPQIMEPNRWLIANDTLIIPDGWS
jgi:lysozyme